MRCACSTTFTTGHPSHIEGVDAELIEGDIRDANTLDKRPRRGQLGRPPRRLRLGRDVGREPARQFRGERARHLPGARRGAQSRHRPRRARLDRRCAHRRRRAARERALAAQAHLALWGEQARRRGLRARLCQVLRPRHGRAAVRERLRALERAQEGRHDAVLPGDRRRRADRHLRRRLRLARLHPCRRHLPGPAAGPRVRASKAAPSSTSPPASRRRSKTSPTCAAAPPACPTIPIEYRPKRAGEVERNFASYDLAHELLGYAPTIEREEGIRRTWEWFEESVFAKS